MNTYHARNSWMSAVVAAAGLALITPAVHAQVEVSADVTGTAVPGAALTATAVIDVLPPGCTVATYLWTQEAGVPVVMTNETTDTATVTLPGAGVFKDKLFEILAEPPIAEADFPPYVPAGEFLGGLQDRFQIVGLDPFSHEETGLVTLKLVVTTDVCGTATAEAEVLTKLPWKVSTGIHNVPIGLAVLLHGKDGVAPPYDWALAAKPGGSLAALTDGTSQNPEFTPDVPGLYRVTVTDTTASKVVTLQIYAGTWEGAITGQNGDGRPLAAGCTGCHDGSEAPDKFTPWAQTGHAEIFSSNLDTSTHYGESCFPCHVVGYDTDVANQGFDDASDYAAFLAAGLLNKSANIQCENCHGPQGSDAHMEGESRISLSADVCGSCHGEPTRHARFQQWQISGHANYELAIAEGGSGSCARCHSANGFLAWTDAGNNPNTSVAVTWTEDETHPQTCVTCHDPHAIGTTTGIGTNATMRITGNTPQLDAGFTAYGVGKGAICMTCHNSRRGLRNDTTFTTSDASRAPHVPTQADVLMGQNAYLVDVGIRGRHSLINNTCVTCHMDLTPPPALLSNNYAGTNHTFFASKEICSNCHGDAFNAEGVQGAFEASMEALQGMIEESILQLMEEQIAAGHVIDLNGEATITDVADVDGIVLGDSHGRHAITVTFTDMTTVGPVSLNSVHVLDPDSGLCPGLLSRCELYDFADSRLPKAVWNSMLLENDQSKGVHNPAFVLGVLDASIDALAAVASGGEVADTVQARFNAVKGTRVSIKVKASSSNSAPTVALRDGAGTEINLRGTLVASGTSVNVKNFEIPTSGVYTFEIGGVPAIGNFKAKTRGKIPKQYAFSGAFPADDEQSFDVLPGSVLKGKVKAARGSAYRPTIDSLEDKGGALAIEGLTASGMRAKFKSAVATAGGTVTMTLGGTAAGDYTGKVRVKAPKQKKMTILVGTTPALRDINLGDSIILE
jgi:hypothetical protein